jgi:hypothetical protein
MTMRMLLRRRIVLILLAIIPAVFLLTVAATTPESMIAFRIASLSEEIWIEVQEEQISLIFFAVASAGFLVAFLALHLTQKDSEVNRRLVICGFHPLSLLTAQLSLLILMIVLIAIYIALFVQFFFSIEHIGGLIWGLCLTGFVYGCYGMLVGSLIKGELEGILMIVLLANLDAGWLQNPLFYAGAQNQVIIQYLPAYYPSQVSIIAAFTDYEMLSAGLYSLLYGAIFLMLSMLIFFTKMRTKK